MDDGKRQAQIIGAFLLGGIIGSGLAILFAPQSGKRTREDIAWAANKVKRRTEDVAEDVAYTVKNVMGDLGGLLSDVIGQGKHLTEDVKESLVDIIENSQKTFAEQKAKLLAKAK